MAIKKPCHFVMNGQFDTSVLQNGDTKSPEARDITHLANSGDKIVLEKFYYSWRFEHYKEFGDQHHTWRFCRT